MRSAIFIALCLAVATVSAYTTEDEVVILTDANFADAMAEFDYALVEFYAPWCGHCKTLAPQYAAAAQQLAKTNPEIKLCKVDSTIEKEIAGKFEIRGYPTLKFFTKGSSTPIAYEGGRTTPEIINWLKKKAGPSSVEVTSVETAEKLIGDNEVLAFFFGPAGEAYSAFLAVANTFDDVAFANSNEQSVKDKFEVTGENGLVLFKKFDEGKNVFTGSFDQGSIKEFLNGNRFPTILPFDQKAAQKIFGEGLEAIFLITDNSEASKAAEQALRDASADLKGKIILSLAKMGEGLTDRLTDYIGVAKDKLPAVRLVQAGQNMQKYPLESEITAENLKTLVSDFKEGKLKPYFKSEPIPENSHEDGVRVVVGKNFDEVVLDENTDVLMEYYAPWCGHCKTLAPIYSAVARKLKDVSGLVIGKMDATANEVEGLSVQGFPTLKFYPKGNKSSPVDYNGERTEEGFIDYLRKNSKAQLPQAKPEDVEL